MYSSASAKRECGANLFPMLAALKRIFDSALGCDVEESHESSSAPVVMAVELSPVFLCLNSSSPSMSGHRWAKVPFVEPD